MLICFRTPANDFKDNSNLSIDGQLLIGGFLHRLFDLVEQVFNTSCNQVRLKGKFQLLSAPCIDKSILITGVSFFKYFQTVIKKQEMVIQQPVSRCCDNNQCQKKFFHQSHFFIILFSKARTAGEGTHLTSKQMFYNKKSTPSNGRAFLDYILNKFLRSVSTASKKTKQHKKEINKIEIKG